MVGVIVGTADADFGVNVVTAGNIIVFDGLRSLTLFLVITIILYNKILVINLHNNKTNNINELVYNDVKCSFN